MTVFLGRILPLGFPADRRDNEQVAGTKGLAVSDDHRADDRRG
jgi:hypothetical protein